VTTPRSNRPGDDPIGEAVLANRTPRMSNHEIAWMLAHAIRVPKVRLLAAGAVVDLIEEITHLLRLHMGIEELADAPPEARYDDATYGRYSAGTSMTLTSSITNSGTSVSITTAAGKPTLTTNASMYPLDLVIDGERVTVASAPAGSSSPQTVTVTRGVAPTVAVAHSAGAQIDVWYAATYAL
jgi:hypothetical protein